MAIVTLLTDSGESDHYVAAIKAKIISVNPGIRIEDYIVVTEDGYTNLSAALPRDVKGIEDWMGARRA